MHLHSPLLSGREEVAVHSQLPVGGITFILGKDLAGDTVVPSLGVVDDPVVFTCCSERFCLSCMCDFTLSDSTKMDDIADLNTDECSVLPEEKKQVE